VKTIYDLRPGMIGFGPLSGAAAAAMWGQFILGEGFTVGRLKVGHVFVITERSTWLPSASPYPVVHAVEAMPRGAVETWISSRWTPKYAYVQLPEDYAGQAADAAAIARAMVGTPYSFASYAALAAWRFGIATPRLEKWIGRRRGVEVPGTSVPARAENDIFAIPHEAICSVLADQAWSLTGKKIFDDGRPHQCVTPGALAGRLLSMPGATWLWPGRS
jgi:hypothetical protein